MHANKSIPHTHIFLGVYTIAGEIHFCVHLNSSKQLFKKKKEKEKKTPQNKR
jgi:hypothetical protein